jgi:hypothetical protein
MNVLEYYRNRHVRSRMIEFLGGKTFDSATSMFITQCDAVSEGGWDFKKPSELEHFWNLGQDVSRSLWDQKWLIAHLDIEYVNFDFPAEPYLDPVRTFLLQRPAELAIQKILQNCGVSSLHILSGRGHHFSWKISRESTAFGKLVEIGYLPEHVEKKYADSLPPANMPIERDLGAAFAGLSLLMEYIAILVKEEADKTSELPVELSAVEVPSQIRGREMISIDITEYGDLLNTRLIRIPYSLYLKPWYKSGVLNDEIKDKIPYMVAVPLFEMGIQEGIDVMRNLESAADLASRAPSQIPDQTPQMLELIRAYEVSNVALYHTWFYSEEHEPPELWPSTYDRAPIEIMPPCTQFILQNPNDLLLRPVGIRLVVRVLLSLGWHPRQIAGLIRSKYERNYGWGREWYFYDAATRADFYTRVFAGLIKMGQDDLKTFDCIPVMESQFCHCKQTGCKLQNFKNSLLERVRYERLAGRPFNGLFLPVEHL